MTDQQIEYVKKHGEKLTLAQMSQELRCTYDMIRRECIKYGITPTKSYWQSPTFIVPPFTYNEPEPEEYERPKARYDNMTPEEKINYYLSLEV